MKILITDKIDPKVLESYHLKTIQFDYRPEITKDELFQVIGDYEGLIVRSRTKVTKNIINQAKKLKVIGRAGAGLDNVDLKAASKNKVVVINTPGVNSNAVAELTIALILTLLRRLDKAYLSMKNGLWIKKELKGIELKGKTVGILGYGYTGQKVKKLLSSFDVKVNYFSRRKKNITLKKLFQTSDIITVHLSINSLTKNLINKELLSKMKPTAYLVNISRGAVIDEKDLYEILKNKKIAGAALDVYWSEPLPPDSNWRSLDNVILTPHIGASTAEALAIATKEVIEKTIKNLK